jgi:hypothetical protein
MGNTFVGAQAGQATTGGPNTFIGEKAGQATNTLGTENLFVGNRAQVIANTNGGRHTLRLDIRQMLVCAWTFKTATATRV